MNAEDSGIEMLGTKYSGKLRALHDRVVQLYERPIKIEATTGEVDNAIQVLPQSIILRLRPGSTEDNVAHEFVHPILQHEGYPMVFGISGIILSTRLAAIIRADFDHLVINARLLALGYDPHNGFLKTVASYESYLTGFTKSDPNAKAVAEIGILHALLKFHFYVGDLTAEPALLGRYPEVHPSWKELRTVVESEGENASPHGVWRIVETFRAVADRICSSYAANFRFSDLIGFEPVPLNETDLKRKARKVFEESSTAVKSGQVLRRTFYRRTHILIAVHVTPRGTTSNDLELATSDFLKARKIRPLLLK